jgi:hypothetical protein
VIKEMLEIVTKQQKSITEMVKAFKIPQNIESGRTILNQNQSSHLRGRQGIGRILKHSRNEEFK